MFPIKVAVVAIGDPSIASEAEYRKTASELAESLNAKMVKDGGKDTRQFEAVVVDSPEAAFSGPLQHVGGGILVFVSKRYWERAKKIAAERHRDVRVYVLAGTMPRGEPVLIDKRWSLDIELADLIR